MYIPAVIAIQHNIIVCRHKFATGILQLIYGRGGCGKDVDGRIKVAWSRWRDLSGVIYDMKVPVKLKSKLYNTVVRPAMVYGIERWTLRKQEEQRLNTTEMKIIRWSQGKTNYTRQL